ncbi:glycosyltransferase [Bipolaris maydis]|nr:glycosyltransferase [Bipolaris maydis]
MVCYMHRPIHQYELVPRDSIDEEQHDAGRDPLDTTTASRSSWLDRLPWPLANVNKLSERAVYVHYVTPRRRKRSLLRLIYWTIFSVPYLLILLVLVTGAFFPSYTIRPPHYDELRKRAITTGRANPYNETVFIVASLAEHKGDLTSGAWGKEVLQLIDLLGPENVHLSIYEDNPDPVTKQSLKAFRDEVKCNSTIIAEDLDLASLPHVTLPNGEERLKRIAFLAEVRNRALAPIDTYGVKFDKLLYLNDVNFDPIEAAQLLFATNIDSNGRADYAAACAVDHIMPFKFYDRFATRDYDGMVTGLPFFPWFTSAGTATSRSDVLEGRDAVRVRSCWSGMVAFEAKWFQARAGAPADAADPQAQSPNRDLSPLRFRYDKEQLWEASECCLINADLQYRMSGKGRPTQSRIYMNPFVRVAYDEKTLSWLSLIRRPERLYAPIHDILNYFVGFPETHARFAEEPGEVVTDKVWVFDNPAAAFAPNATEVQLAGHYVERTRKAEPASIICVDVVIRQFPGKKNFKIEQSNAFLSTGLSLSFGVMIFSSLYNMLPSAKKYLIGGGMLPRNAILTMIGCFLVGALGISVVSGILHKYIPHSVVDCNDEHGDEEHGKDQEEHGHSHEPMQEQQSGLLQAEAHHEHQAYGTSSETSNAGQSQRPLLHKSFSSKMSQLVTRAEKICNENHNGECYGDFCEIRPTRLQSRKSLGSLTAIRPSAANRNQNSQGPHDRKLVLEDVDETTPLIPTRSVPATLESSLASLPPANGHTSTNTHQVTPTHKHSRSSSVSSHSSHDSHFHGHNHNHSHGHGHDLSQSQHHHHVPTNVFLSLGLQTSTAIALHKIPEGFITYATNHANPTLGFSIFLALFVHNITEGFALALPLYLAINSRWKAMLISTILGGVSQPLGAGVAALWFKVQGRGRGSGTEDGEMDTIYGCMFAVTAGIMAMVSLQLLGESLDLTNSRRLCFVSAFAGMGILGLSSALTA